MSLTLHVPTADDLEEITEAVATWQHEGSPVQVHPGDIGWNSTFGPEQIAKELRVWRRDGELVAVAMGDDDGYVEESLVRMAVAPGVAEDSVVATQLVADLTDRTRGVLPGTEGQVEARFGAALRNTLVQQGWQDVEPWTPLVHDLTGSLEQELLEVRLAGSQDADDRVAVHRASFNNSTFTVERWLTLRDTPAYRRARCLIAYDNSGAPVAGATVWSAGQGRPGVLEPLGVHRDYQGRGYGRAISVAAAAALRELGASSATVCTPATNVAAVRTYASAGYRQLPDVTDFRRPG